MDNGMMNQFIFTASNMETFRTCRLKFYLRYIQKLLWPAQITMDSLQFEKDRDAGVRFHHLLHQYFLGLNIEILEEMAKRDADSRILKWFHAFRQSPFAQLNGNLSPEKTIRCAIGGSEFLAKYDLIQMQGDQFTIYDWKTSKKVPSLLVMKNSLQTRLYSLVLKETVAKTNPIKFVYWELNQANTPYEFTINDETLMNYKSQILKIAMDIKNTPIESFIKTSDIRRCAYCEYRSLCKRGTQAHKLEDLDDASLLSMELIENWEI